MIHPVSTPAVRNPRPPIRMSSVPTVSESRDARRRSEMTLIFLFLLDALVSVSATLDRALSAHVLRQVSEQPRIEHSLAESPSPVDEHETVAILTDENRVQAEPRDLE